MKTKLVSEYICKNLSLETCVIHNKSIFNVNVYIVVYRVRG